MLKTELLIGTVGWQHKEWIGGFYPDDLPEDWCLGYYSNRLRAVLVPVSTWSNDKEDLQDWPEDIYPEFRMVLEWQPGKENPQEDARKLIERTKPIASNVDAFLIMIGGVVSDKILQAMEILSEEFPVIVTGKGYGEVPDDSPVFALDGIGQCWLADKHDKPAQRGNFLIALTETGDAKTTRQIIEKIDAWPDEMGDVKGAALFFLGKNAPDHAVQARTLAELMGV